MTAWERRKIELDLKSFTSRNFVSPDACQNLEDIRAYIKLLCEKMEEFQVQHGFVPDHLYTMLSRYNTRQNEIIGLAFRQNYCPS